MVTADGVLQEGSLYYDGVRVDDVADDHDHDMFHYGIDGVELAAGAGHLSDIVIEHPIAQLHLLQDCDHLKLLDQLRHHTMFKEHLNVQLTALNDRALNAAKVVLD